MIVRKLVCLLTVAVLGVGVVPARAQEAPAKPAAHLADTPPAPAKEGGEKALEWKDYSVKGYSLSAFGGSFSGATYLDLMPLAPRTVLTPGAGDIIAYDGSVLAESIQPADPTQRKYNAPRKEIEPGSVFGGRVGIYVGEDFHLDLNGSYMTGRAVTSMLYNPDSSNPENEWTRIEVDADEGFSAYKGGLSLMYDARPATFYGITPIMGFGLGGVINRYSELEDKTALYLEANFGLSVEAMKDFRIVAGADVAVFAYEVDELGYSNMVSYKNLMIGATWFLDTVPAEVRAKHEAEPKTRR